MLADRPRRPAHEEDWESRLRPTPTAARVRATLASEGAEGGHGEVGRPAAVGASPRGRAGPEAAYSLGRGGGVCGSEYRRVTVQIV